MNFVEDHMHAVLSSATETLHGLRVLRSHGVDDEALQMVYQAVIVSKLQYASCAWWGFSTAVDRQRVKAFELLFGAVLVAFLTGRSTTVLLYLSDSRNLMTRMLYVKLQ